MNKTRVKPIRTAGWLLLALIALAIPAGAVTQSGKRVAIGRVTGKIVPDGVLDEPDWAQAAALGEILQREPKQETAATTSAGWARA